MRLDYEDKAILEILTARQRSIFEVKEELRIRSVRLKFQCGWVDQRLTKMMRVGLVASEAKPEIGRFYSITELGHKLLKSCDRKDAK